LAHSIDGIPKDQNVVVQDYIDKVTMYEQLALSECLIEVSFLGDSGFGMWTWERYCDKLCNH